MTAAPVDALSDSVMMRNGGSKSGLAAAAFALCLAAAVAHAADTLKPRPAEMMPRAQQTTLLDIAYANQQYVAVGQRGHILVSWDGRHWTQVAAPVRAMLNQLRFVDDQYGWAVGHDGTILATRDGGANWSLQHFDPKAGRPYNAVLFLDRNRGFVGGASGRFLQTVDGGATWTDVQADIFDLALNINALCRLRDGSILLAGEKGLLAQSTDDGRTWRMLKPPYGGSFFGALPVGDAGVLVFGLRGRVYVARDVKKIPAENPKSWDEFAEHNIDSAQQLAAIGWTQIANPAGQSLFGGTLADDNTAALVGVNGTVLRVDLAAATATLVPGGIGSTLSAARVNGGEVIAVGHEGVQHLPWAVKP